MLCVVDVFIFIFLCNHHTLHHLHIITPYTISTPSHPTLISTPSHPTPSPHHHTLHSSPHHHTLHHLHTITPYTHLHTITPYTISTPSHPTLISTPSHPTLISTPSHSPVHVAAGSGMVGALEVLASYGADLSQRTAHGATALHEAAASGHTGVEGQPNPTHAHTHTHTYTHIHTHTHTYTHIAHICTHYGDTMGALLFGSSTWLMLIRSLG